ncbi:MAG: inositol phosphorylceramide synthase [Deltaproteobacteria bacterium]|nr:MAG: inositol phosphorylceramide synthase [Deltaproteobacteria bacterium]
MVQLKQQDAASRGWKGWRDIRWWFVALVIVHLAFVVAAIGLRVEHVLIDVVVLVLAFASARSRRILMYLLPFWWTGFLYESVHLLLPLRGPIHIADFYGVELALFGVGDPAITLAEWFIGHTSVVVDVVSGLAYMLYLLEPPLLVLLLLLARRDEARATQIAWTFLAVNVLGLLTQLAFPVAPPWYILEHGLGPAVLDAAPSPAGAARFDAATGIAYFASFYSRNANVFGAFPSLHSAYPFLCALVVAPLGKRWWIPTVAFAALIGFSAVYLQHHYLLDVLGGWLFATLAFLLVRQVLGHRTRSRSARRSCPPAPA